MSALSGRRVWITGASSGIGAALAHELAERGSLVAITARRADALDEVAGGRPDIVPFPGDVTDAAAMAAVAASIADRWGAVDLAVLNAGTYRPVTVDEFGASVVRDHFEVNVLGVVNCLDACLPAMRGRRSGRVAIMSSVTAFVGFPLAAAYGSTKAYLANMGESLRADLARDGVGVTVIFPGFVRTQLTDQNAFRMPLIINVDEAARLIADGLERDAAEIGVPRRAMVATRLAARLPGAVRRRWLRRMADRRQRERS